MNKDQFNSALDKINASEEFKNKVKHSMEKYSGRERTLKSMKLLPVLTIVIAVIALGAFYLSHQSLNRWSDTGEFRITGKMHGEAKYASVLYLDGYEYGPSEWFSYSWGDFPEEQSFEIGEKLGEVSLDLKGIKYTGTPPEFSSTYDVGTEIYEIKNIRKERAVLVRTGYEDLIFYREWKAASNRNEPIGLNLSDVFQMMTDQTTVTSIELRSDEDGSWMRTSEDEELLALINQELPQKTLINRMEGEKFLGKDTGFIVNVNLMFSDGAALHVMFFPNRQYAFAFGGYITISEDLANKIAELNSTGDQYDRITDLLPKEPSYIFFKDYVAGKEVLSDNPAWSGGSLYIPLKYYRVTEVQQSDTKKPVMSFQIGKSSTDFTEINFYEDDGMNMIIQVNGKYYEIVKGHLSYDDLNTFLMSTDLK